MADDSTITPRTLIKDLLEAKVTQRAVSAQRRRSRRQSTSTQSAKSMTDDPVPQPSTARKNKRRSSFSDVTPRSAIQKFLETHETAKPETRKRRRLEETEGQENAGGYASLSSQRRRSARFQAPVVETPGKNLTPRTVIAGFLRQAVSETPVQSQKGSDGHSLPPIPPEPLLMVEDSPLNITAHQRPRRSPRTVASSYVPQHSVQFDFTLGSIAEGEDEREVIPESQPQPSPEREHTQGEAWKGWSLTPRSGRRQPTTPRSGSSTTQRRQSLRRSTHGPTNRASVDGDSEGRVGQCESGTDCQWEPTVVSDLNSRERLSHASDGSGVEKLRWQPPRRSGVLSSHDLSYPERSARDASTSEEEESRGRGHRQMSAGMRVETSAGQDDDGDVLGEQIAAEAGGTKGEEVQDSRTEPYEESEARGVQTSAQPGNPDNPERADNSGDTGNAVETSADREKSDEENINLHISDNSDDKDNDNVDGDNEVDNQVEGENDVGEGEDQVDDDVDEDKDQVDDGENDTEDGEKVDDGTASDAAVEVRESVSEDHGTDRNMIYPHTVNTTKGDRSQVKDSSAVISEEQVIQEASHDLPVLGDSPTRPGHSPAAPHDSPAGPGDSPSMNDVNRRPEDSAAMVDVSVESEENSEEGSTPSHRVQKYVPVKTPSTLRNMTLGKMRTPTSVSRLATNMTSTPKPQTKGTMVQQRTIKHKPRPDKKTKPISKLRMPASLTKGIFGHFLKSNVSKDVMNEVEKIADKYWTNVTSDLGAFADHAGRVTVTEEDVELLMKRQGFATDRRSMFTLVEHYLPLEYKQEIVPMARAGNVLYPHH